MVDGKTERALNQVVEHLRELFGPRLLTVALYGSAAGADFVPGVSDVNIVAVIDGVKPTDLDALRPLVARAQKHRVATPLLVDLAFLRDAADVFPMEFFDIKGQHRMLFGEDVFATVAVDGRQLRYQCEHEARGKLLRLQALYLEVGNKPKQLKVLLMDSLKTFLIIMRSLNRLRGVHEPASYSSVLQTFSEQFNATFPALSRLLNIKLGREAWPADVAALARDYLEEMQRLVDLIDPIPEDALPAHVGG
jgi:predicted nucleotidyltransferase